MNGYYRLGHEPVTTALPLTAGSDWRGFGIQRLVDGVPTDWPGGATLQVVWLTGGYGAWSAVLVDDLATFVVESTVADTIPAGTPYVLRYHSGTIDVAVCVGTVERAR